MTPTIVVVGLGPGDPALRTVETEKAIAQADRIILRTRIHPGLQDLSADPRVSSCDDLYEALPTFEQVYAAIVERLLNVAETEGSVVYAVPGHPRFGEHSVSLLLAAAAEQTIAVEVRAAVSVLDVVAIAADLDPLLGLQLIDGLHLRSAADAEPFSGGTVAIDPAVPCFISQVHDRQVASAVKLRLARSYPEDHPVWMVTSAGVAATQGVTVCPLFELDRQPVDHLTSVIVPPLAPLDAARSAATLQRIVAHLRAPAGCPWDRAQTHRSIRQAVIEEAYETADAIDHDEPEELAEELGDLLLQVALHSQMAEEAGTFTLEDVYAQVNRKLIRRHPHVFGDVTVETASAVVQTWDAVKAAERNAAGKLPKGSAHPLDELPRSMPAMEKARALLGPRKGERPLSRDPELVSKAGKLLLDAVDAAIAVNVDPEQALERALRDRLATPNLMMENTRP